MSPGKQVLEKVLALFSEVENEADRVRILKQLMRHVRSARVCALHCISTGGVATWTPCGCSAVLLAVLCLTAPLLARCRVFHYSRRKPGRRC